MSERDHTDLGFAYQAAKGGEVRITRHGRAIATLRGDVAASFLADVQAADDEERQLLMARLTGNYRRGNEAAARSHPRNRR